MINIKPTARQPSKIILSGAKQITLISKSKIDAEL
jgi:hypothetical protein